MYFKYNKGVGKKQGGVCDGQEEKNLRFWEGMVELLEEKFGESYEKMVEKIIYSF